LDRRPISAPAPTVSSSIARGLNFIAAAHTPYHFVDPYLEYVYSGEKLECGLPGCRATYRTLDAYFALTMIKPRLTQSETRAVSEVLAESDSVLADMVTRWRAKPIYNTLTSTEADTEGIALDTYCILGTLTDDATMAQQAVKYLTPDGNWIADDNHKNDTWRNIADETWCLRLLARTNTAPERLAPMIQKKVEETRAYLDSTEPANFKLAVLYHMLILMKDLTGPNYSSLIKEYQNSSAELFQSGVADNDPLALGNLLEALVETKYVHVAILRDVSQKLIGLQEADGAWRAQGDYPVFASLRSLAGLTAYQEAQR
jgi:hypothetical protein